MRAAILQIYNKNASSLSFEELYRAAYTLVLNKNGSRLYAGIQDLIASHLDSSIPKLVIIDDGSEFMRMFLSEWDEHMKVLGLICDIVMYMDHNFVRAHNKPPTRDMGLRLFQTHVLLSPTQVGERFIQGLLELIDDSRCPDTSLIDSSSIPKLVSILIETSLGRECEDLYESLFLCKFLDRTEQYYTKKAAAMISLSHSEYVNAALDAYDAELSLVSRGFDTKYTYPKVVEGLNKSWITPYYTCVVSESFSVKVQSPDLLFLEKIYRLYSRTTQSHQCLVEEFVTMVQGSLKSSLEIGDLIAHRKRIFSLTKECFHNDSELLFRTRQMFETVINEGGDQISRTLCKFMDENIRKSENFELLDECLELFKFVRSKDVFEGYYKFYLGKRLVGGGSLETERLVLGRLKAECGSGFTSKIEGMINDIANSNELMNVWGQRVMTVKILTMGLWPGSLVGASSKVPPSHQFEGIEDFETFYNGKFSGRVLTWCHSLGSMEIRGRFDSGIYTFHLTAIQGMILTEMQKKSVTSFSSMPGFCESNEMKRHFISMIVNPKCRLVVPAGDDGPIPKSLTDLNENQEWMINDKYSCTTRGVRVPLIVGRDFEVALDQQEDPADTGIGTSVEEDRKHLLEAALIRVMKGRKMLDQNNLVAEVVALMSGRFVPAIETIKNRIENLVEREFLRKDDTDIKVYHYVA